MADSLDQIFVLLKHWLVAFFPADWQPLISALLSIAAIIVVFASLFALTLLSRRRRTR